MRSAFPLAALRAAPSFALALPLFACSAGAADPGSPPDGDPAAVATALARCEGVFVCRGGGGAATTTLRRDEGACFAGRIRLDDGGAAEADGEPMTWSIRDDGFDVCASGGACMACRPATPSSPSADEHEKECQGLAWSCSNRAPGTCSDQLGCFAGSRIRWNGELEFECKGSPRSCSSFTSQSSCARQDGCTWR